MPTFRTFEEIEAWKKARDLAREIYAATNGKSFSKDFRLRDQIRDASVSVMSNIAEGFERGGNREFHHFLSVAKGSAGEVRSDLYVALDLSYIEPCAFGDLMNRASEVGRMIAGLMDYLRGTRIKGAKFKPPGNSKL